MDINWMISYVNKNYPLCMPYEFFTGQFFDNAIQHNTETSRKGFQMTSYMFNLNVKKYIMYP